MKLLDVAPIGIVEDDSMLTQVLLISAIVLLLLLLAALGYVVWRIAKRRA